MPINKLINNHNLILSITFDTAEDKERAKRYLDSELDDLESDWVEYNDYNDFPNKFQLKFKDGSRVLRTIELNDRDYIVVTNIKVTAADEHAAETLVADLLKTHKDLKEVEVDYTELAN